MKITNYKRELYDDGFCLIPNPPFILKNGELLQYSYKRHEWVVAPISTDNLGYKHVSWYDIKMNDRRNKRVHSVIWELYYNKKIPDNMEIDHINGDKSDNSIENLRLVTHKENMKFARERLGSWGTGKLTDRQYQCILLLPPNFCWKLLAEKWNVSKNHLINIRSQLKKKGFYVNPVELYYIEQLNPFKIKEISQGCLHCPHMKICNLTAIPSVF